MPVEIKPLFRPEVVARAARQFHPEIPEAARSKLDVWADALRRERFEGKETELLPQFLVDVFVGVLGYEPAPGRSGRFTISREQHVEVDGEFADACLGRFGGGTYAAAAETRRRYEIVVEGKGPRDPLDRPHGGRRRSAVEQVYDYAVGLGCDWMIVTNIRELRLYSKLTDRLTYERFDVIQLADDPTLLRRFVFLLGAGRVLPDAVLGAAAPAGAENHLYGLRANSERAGRELTADYYDQYAKLRREVFAALRAENPDVPPADLLAAVQTLLDRVLFVAFAEDRGLLPTDTLRAAFAHADPYNPRPVWENFRGLFRAVDEGREPLRIPRYNGGLFAENTLLDERLIVPDAACRDMAALGKWEYRPPSEATSDDPDAKPIVDVDVLGHIFEQSITDLERLRAEAVAGTAPARARNDTRSRRKREGAFYTPAFVTNYIVNEALGGVLRDRFESLRQHHRAEATAPTRSALDDPAAYEAEAITPARREVLIRFWEAWQTELSRVRVIDPACGSGAFLVEAFDQLHRHYEDVNGHLAALRGQPELYDLDRHILQRNLYGVDLNGEAVEIAKLSLWIKTARRGQVLTDLDGTIKAGNSVVNDPGVDQRAFDWRREFADVFADGGFDAAVMNPPYVRQELLGPIKPHLESRFRSYHGMADLYTYFFELALDLLKPGGRLGAIVTNKWLRSGYAQPLRRHLAEASWVESLVDFGHAKQIFPQADVFPAILVAQKPAEGRARPAPRVAVIPREQLRIDDLARQVAADAFETPPEMLTSDGWSLEPPGVVALMAKIAAAGVPLKEYASVEPQYGIKTGLNDAFLIDTDTRERIVREDPNSRDIIRPYLRGQDIERWHPAWAGQWMIFTRRGIDIEKYPGVLRHLEHFRERLEPKPSGWDDGTKWPGRKGGPYRWYEIQDTVAYWKDFERPKIIYQVIQYHPQFAFDTGGRLGNDKTYVLAVDDPYLLAVLNSPLMWWRNWRVLTHLKDEALSPMSYMVDAFPIAPPSDDQRVGATSAVYQLVEIARRRQETERGIADWLRAEFDVEKPSQRLAAPVGLDADAFIAEVRKARGRKKPMSAAQVQALRREHAETIEPVRAEAAEAARLERALADLVHAAYGLTEADLDLMWRTAPPRMPLPAPAI